MDEFSIGGQRQFMKTTIVTNFDPTSTSGIEGVGHHKYLLIGAWLECESCSINLEGLVTLRLEGLRCSTQGALVLVILYVSPHLAPM